MLVLKYFLAVGAVLAVGLVALSSHMESQQASSSRRAPSTATIAVAPPPAKPAPATVSLIDEQIAPQEKARSGGRRSTR
jgi:hypothetical protein